MFKILITDDETSVQKGPWYDVVPTNRVLGSAPVMRSRSCTETPLEPFHLGQLGAKLIHFQWVCLRQEAHLVNVKAAQHLS